MRQLELMRARVGAVAQGVVDASGDKFRAIDHAEPHPRSTEELEWDRDLRSKWEVISGEWNSFRAAGGRLPSMEMLVGQSLGNSGVWEAGVLVSGRRTPTLLARHFPLTLGALGQIPGLRSALWSVLSPGAEIPQHRGPDPGVLRFHLGVDCPEGAALGLEQRPVAYRNGETILFDDTELHEAWNRSDRERVTLFCELLRPLPSPWRYLNRASHEILALTPRFRASQQRCDAWHLALNPRLVASPELA